MTPTAWAKAQTTERLSALAEQGGPLHLRRAALTELQRRVPAARCSGRPGDPCTEPSAAIGALWCGAHAAVEIDWSESDDAYLHLPSTA